MTKRIFGSIMIAAGAVLLASLGIVVGVLYQYFSEVQQRQLVDEMHIAAEAVEDSGLDYLRELQLSQYRITWIDAGGRVLFDSQADAEQAENHAEREEVVQALESGLGQSTRYSSTLLQQTMYRAIRLEDGSILRLSVSQATVWVLLLGMLQPILVVLGVALVSSGFLAHGLSRRIVEPLNHIDLEHPLDNDTYEELSPLLRRISLQHQQIAGQMRRLQRKTDEFDQITASMTEGLVLLDGSGKILSINPAARRLFGADGAFLGRDYRTLDRHLELGTAMEQALAAGHAELRMERGGREYQFGISRILSEGAVIGAVLLTFDVTEQAQAERRRREFSANVSHELKTPLQGIIGSADLISSGMVKNSDLPRFVGHIRREAARLVTLIEDIIRLSQLDEQNEIPTEPVELYSIAENVIEQLSDAAGNKGLTFHLRGAAGNMEGAPGILHEIIYNLCDNAVKYSNSGTIDVEIAQQKDGITLTVADQDIGIPEAYQGRIFERFYRVDKSHSKASGGTGLGLSIVKHGVLFHHGTIDLTSTPGKGTRIAIHFPAP